MTRRRHPRGLASRFFLAQAIVVAASILAAVAVASLAGPPIFHEHLIMAGHAENSPELLHVERAYRDAGLIVLGVALGTALVCAAAVTWLFTRRLRQPLAALTEAARGVSRGRYGTRVPALGAGVEVDAVAASFNTMAERLERTEEGRIDLDRASQPAGDLARSAAETQREAYAAKGVRLVLDVDDDAGVVDVDRQRMGQVLGNLLTNALRHTPPGGQVSLGVARRRPGRVTVTVADTGDGIAAEHLPRVFERFWRGDSARDRDHGGSGIGLTISRALVEAHGGTLTVTSPGPGAGTAFTVELPSRQRVRPSPVEAGR